MYFEDSREIDELIAEHVMDTGSRFEGGYLLPKFLPEYSTDIKHAWEVVEKMENFHENSRDTYFKVDRSSSGWRVSFWRLKRHEGEDDNEYFHGASKQPTIARAICLSALQAMGIEYKVKKKKK